MTNGVHRPARSPYIPRIPPLSDAAMTRPIKIDFVSDVSCPWCIIGLKGLEEALARVGDLVEADIRFQPFELNPHMPAEGQDLVEHVAQKYGSTPEQYFERREMIRARAAELGFTIAAGSAAGRVWNTFDAHRLLHWAGLQGEGRQRALKLALFEAYFTDGQNPGDPQVLREAAAKAGLDPDEAGQDPVVRPLCRRGPRRRAFLAAAGHFGRPRDHHRRALPHLRRPARRRLRTGPPPHRRRGTGRGGGGGVSHDRGEGP